jgi:metal-responsive CopG/Arc/MetJ family transcriptional regulator
MSEKDFVGFKLNPIELIALDAHAKTARVSRSEFIKLAINEKINKARQEQEAKQERNDLQKVYQAITELNATVNEKLDKQNTNLKLVFNRTGRIEELLKTHK